MINNKHEKLAIVRERFEPGKSVSMVARQHGVNANQLFRWCKLYQDGSLSAVNTGEEVVPASKLSDALKQIKELQRLIGKKAMENEMLREAAEVMKWRKWIARSNVAVELARPADGHDDGAAQSGTRQVHGQPRRRLGTRMLAR